ncbi:MAG: aldo/keto reductase [Tissierellia bacterium]|nr:aldo/keto reductase [Tissierellia bacterium]
MERRILGRTNFEVSVIGFGGIPIQRVDKDMAIQLIGEAKRAGMNFIDTARGYTISESLIGYGLERWGRENFILATKSMKRDYDGIMEELNISLRDLRTDYIDLYQFHNVRTFEELDMIMADNGALKAMKEAKKKGIIGEFGITGHNVDVMEKALETGEFATIQFPYNSVEKQAEDMFKRAKDLNIGVIVMKPLAGGALGNASLSLKFIANNPNVTSVIPGMESVEQIRENSRIGYDLEPLNEEEMEILRKEAEELGTEFCRRCGYCLPCPQGIDIPIQFLMEGYYTRYNLKDWAKERYMGMDVNAADCIECAECESKCPYDLPIIKMLKKVENVLG